MLANNTLKIEYYYSGKLVKDDKNLNELLQMTKQQLGTILITTFSQFETKFKVKY